MLKSRTLQVLVVLLLLLGGGTWAAVKLFLPDSSAQPTVSEETLAEEPKEVDTKTFVTDEQKVVVMIPTDNGYVKQEISYKGKGAELQKAITEDLLFKKLGQSGLIQIPEGSRILDVKIYNETLSINFSKEMLNVKTKDLNSEKKVMASIIKTLRGTSKAFTDVQFLVEGKRVEHLFGFYNTYNPIMDMD